MNFHGSLISFFKNSGKVLGIIIVVLSCQENSGKEGLVPNPSEELHYSNIKKDSILPCCVPSDTMDLKTQKLLDKIQQSR